MVTLTYLLSYTFKLNERIVKAAEWYDAKYSTKPDCTNNIMCECQRYKCEGRIKSVNTFWKELKQL